jgi:hypothetical protein
MGIRTELVPETINIAKNCHNILEKLRITMSLWVILSEIIVTNHLDLTMQEETMLLALTNSIFLLKSIKTLTQTQRATNIPSIQSVGLLFSLILGFRRKITR